MEQRTTTRTLRTHDVSLDASEGCGSLAQVPRTWTTARVRRIDGFQLAESVFDEETALDERDDRHQVELLRGSGSAAASTRT